MTSTHIAFLRGINVGGHVVKMADLRRIFEELGFSDVETYIASGNVAFSAKDGDTAKLERKIERALHEALGYDVATFLRSPKDVAAIAAHKPFSAAASRGWASLYVCFTHDTFNPTARRALEALATDMDKFASRGREAYWLCRTRLTDSLVSSAALGKALGANTQRNITTIRKLAAKFPPAR